MRFAFNRTAIDRSSPPWFSPKDLGSNVYSYQPGEMVLTVTGGFNISAGTATTGRFNTNTYQFSDDLSLVRGNHQISLGANAAYWKMDFLTHARSGGDWNVNGQVTGLGLADLMLGPRRAARARRTGDDADAHVVHRALRAGHVADDVAADIECWHPLGAVPRPGARERTGLQLGSRELPHQCEEHGVRERTRRLHLSG